MSRLFCVLVLALIGCVRPGLTPQQEADEFLKTYAAVNSGLYTVAGEA